MLNEETMGFMADKLNKREIMRPRTSEVKAELSEKEAMNIFNEVIEVYRRHNISYQCACRVTMALNEAFITGAVELYRQEQNKP